MEDLQIVLDEITQTPKVEYHISFLRADSSFKYVSVCVGGDLRV